MNWKLIIGGGLAYYITAFVISFATGPLIHEGVLADSYLATSSFWRPELRQRPPDMEALLPLWITTGILTSFILAGIYGVFRKGLSGPGWQRGVKFGVAVWLLQVSTMAAWSGVFDLPYDIWGWWGAEAALYLIVGSSVMGLAADKLAPVET